jgi:hypothetical protein
VQVRSTVLCQRYLTVLSSNKRHKKFHTAQNKRVMALLVLKSHHNFSMRIVNIMHSYIQQRIAASYSVAVAAAANTLLKTTSESYDEHTTAVSVEQSAYTVSSLVH